MSSPNSPRSGMTKEQLKQILIENGISTPPNSARKEEFQKVYDQHFGNVKKVSEFSSDDDGEADGDGENEVEGQHEEEEGAGPMTYEKLVNLSDPELYQACVRTFGKGGSGPVTGNTRSVYLGKLATHLGLSPMNSPSTTNGNGTTNGASNGYSDSDDEAEVADNLSQSSRASGTSSRTRGVARREGSESTGRWGLGGIRRRSETPNTTGTTASLATDHSPILSGEAVKMSERIKRDEEGMTYFKERPGYVSKTTAKYLPIKPIKRKEKTPEKEREPFSPLVKNVALVFVIVAVLIAMYCTKDTVLGLFQHHDEVGEVDELDDYLESLTKEDN